MSRRPRAAFCKPDVRLGCGWEKKTVIYYGGQVLSWTLAFLLIAFIAAVFGFTGLAVAAAGIAKILFYIFLGLFLLSLISRIIRGGKTRGQD